MKKLLLLLLLPIFVYATAKNPKVLYVHDGTHFSKVRANHVKLASKNKGIEIVYKSTGALGQDSNKSKFEPYDLIMLSGVRSDRSKKFFSSLMQTVDKNNTKVFALSVKDINNTKWRQGISLAQHKQIKDYLSNGGMKNFQGFADFLANDIFGISDKVASKPFIYPKTGIYHPKSPDGRIFESLDEYLKFLDVNISNKKLVGIAMYQGDFGSMDSGLIDKTIEKLSSKKNVIPVAFYAPRYDPKGKHIIPYKKILSLDGKFVINAIAYYQMMHDGLQKKRELEELGVPAFGGMTYRAGNQETYESDVHGVDNFMIPFMLNNPDIAGVINPMMVAAKNEDDETTQSIDYQLDAFLNRIERYLTLQTKENKDKKLAFFFWSSGQNSMGAASLNVPESLALMFDKLKTTGYQTEDINASFFTDRVKDMMALWYREVNATQLLQRDLCELYPLEKYEAWFEKLPKDTKEQISKAWGDANASNMLIEKDGKQYFTIPRMKLGNFVVLPQGSRSPDKKEAKKSLHDKETPANHGYLAVYLYVKEVFGVDAIVHVGTHGTQEFLEGKERGLSVYDSPNLAIGDVPVVYPYILDDVGEAIIAKRRGSAVIISHLTPPFSPAGLHDELVEIHDLMHQYSEMTEGSSKEKTKERLIKISQEQSFDKEIDANASEDFEAYMDELHNYLEELAEENQPLGMHTFSEELRKDHTILTIMQMLGSKYADLANSIDGSSHGHSHGDGHSHDKKSDIIDYKDINKTHAYIFIKETLAGNMPKHEELKPFLEQALKYKKALSVSLEMEGLLNALDGKYIPTSSGGDPVRSPDALPTGKNLFGFDPSKIPTKAAYEAGKELAKEMIENYYAKHAVYPDKFAYSLWSTETMRHYGVLESQVLYTLGIKPTWNKGGRVIGMEVIPYSELKRPRVDVVVSTTSLYRDSFPNVMEYLDRAVKKIVALKEDNNHVRINALALQKVLEKEGMSEEEAKKLSSIRVFSNAAGTHMGTGIPSTVMKSGEWEDDKDMAEEYMSRMGFAYGSGLRGDKVIKDLYKKNLKGTDAVAFSRSSNLFGVLSSDHPFEFLGGIGLAVRNIDGKTPEMYIMNLRNKDKGKVESIEKFISKEFRTRYTHPQWIKAMQEEGFSGAGSFLSTIQNTWGWEVVAPKVIRDDQWQELVEVYVNDKHNLKMKEFFEKNNPDALAQISERFLEAIRKGYFKTDEKTVKKLVETYMEMANKHNVYTDNEKFKEYVKGKAIGYGISNVLPSKAQLEFSTPIVKAAGEKPSKAKQKGQKLEEVQQSKVVKDYTYLYFILFILALIISGMLYEYRKRK